MKTLYIYQVVRSKHYDDEIVLLLVRDGLENPDSDILLMEREDYFCVGIYWRDVYYEMKSLEVSNDNQLSTFIEMVLYDRATTSDRPTNNVCQM